MNPELLRNLWLQASPRRIGGLAIALGLIFGAVAMLNRDDPAAMDAVFFIVGLVVFAGCGVVWGALAAGGGVLDEIRDRTWDFQRLSALTPWRMTWGKLAGAAAAPWMGAVSGMIVAGSALALNTQQAGPNGPLALTLVVGLAALGVFTQACAMGAALVGVRKARAEGRVASGGAVLLGLIAGLFLLARISLHLPQFSAAGASGPISQQTISFWGAEAPEPLFITASLLAFAVWAVVGAWRLMRLELQMRNSPWIWVAFLIFAALWQAGLAAPGAGAQGRAFAAAAGLAILTYAAAFIEPADPLRLRRFIAAIAAGRLAEAVGLRPSWLIAVKLTFVAAILALVSPASAAGDLPSAANTLAALSFLCRDLAVIAFFRFGPRPGRGDMSAVLAVALLYGVGGVFDAMIRGQGLALFSPFSPVSPWITFAAGVVQAVAAGVLAAQRIGLGTARETPLAKAQARR